MAEDKTMPAKKVKRAVPEAPAEPKEAKPLPTPKEIRAAKKADLVAWSEAFGLEAEGKVDELRKALLAYVEAEAEPVPAETPAEAEEEAKPKPAKEGAKPAGKAKKAEKATKEPKKEEEEEEEAEEYEAKGKPKLDAETRRLLAMRRLKSSQRPKFHRQEWFRYKKFGDEWRKPHGGQSKLRRHFGYRWNLPSIGFRGPRHVRGLHPSGFQEVLVHNLRQLTGLDPAKQAVRIAHGVGSRKRVQIEEACEEKGLRVLNRMVTE